jgi:anti-sigma factor RsiW
MKAHLTHEELTDRLMGVRSSTVEAHLLGCPACSKELQEMGESIHLFRGAVHSWSESRAGAADLPARSRVLRPRSYDWLLAGAVAMVLVAFSLLYFLDRSRLEQAHTQPTGAVTASSVEQIKQDNELMSQINQELSEGLPAPMQPLQVSASRQSASSDDHQE